jgi:hypothetical protein
MEKINITAIGRRTVNLEASAIMAMEAFIDESLKKWYISWRG